MAEFLTTPTAATKERVDQGFLEADGVTLTKKGLKEQKNKKDDDQALKDYEILMKQVKEKDKKEKQDRKKKKEEAEVARLAD